MLSNEQENVLRVIRDRWSHNEKFTVVGGYAGAGKSFVAQKVPDTLNLASDQVVYASYTGKATAVLANLGCPNAITTHKLLYNFYRLKDGTYRKKAKESLGEIRLVIIDEISMLPKEMLQLLLKHGVHCIFFGDPFQLPPIDEDGDNRLLLNPHCFMQNIIRQAKDNKIITLAHTIRNGKMIPLGYTHESDHVIIRNKNDIELTTLQSYEQVICGYNTTRQKYNKEMSINKSLVPIDGDKLICCKNYWDILSKEEVPLINGTIGYVSNLRPSKNKLGPMMKGNFQPDYSESILEERMLLDLPFMETNLPSVNNSNYRMVPKNSIPKLFSKGYVITCHKSQGSTFNDCIIINEAFGESEEMRRRWLYTAITRAKEKILIYN